MTKPWPDPGNVVRLTFAGPAFEEHRLRHDRAAQDDVRKTVEHGPRPQSGGFADAAKREMCSKRPPIARHVHRGQARRHLVRKPRELLTSARDARPDHARRPRRRERARSAKDQVERLRVERWREHPLDRLRSTLVGLTDET